MGGCGHGGLASAVAAATKDGGPVLEWLRERGQGWEGSGEAPAGAQTPSWAPHSRGHEGRQRCGCSPGYEQSNINPEAR